MKNWERNTTKRFEANMLDGDEIKDSGVTLLNAKDCLEYFLEDIKENFISKQEIVDKIEELEFTLYPYQVERSKEWLDGYNYCKKGITEDVRKILKIIKPKN